jgi:hypothetical protein
VIVVTNLYDCKLCKCGTACEIIVSDCSYIRVGEDCNKGSNNPNSVFSGETRYNW